MKRRPKTDLHTPWKEALEHFLEAFLAFFFPAIHAILDWTRGYESLDKELHQIIHDARAGPRLADKLFKAWRKDGEEAWLLIHVEVQGRREKDFGERMFDYWNRIFQLYRQPVISLAVPCDADPGWKPDRFCYSMCGCSVDFRFPIAKILDYRGQEERLETDPNPFAAVVLAQFKVLDTKKSPVDRKVWKLRMSKGLYERGFSAEDVRKLFRFIDWMMTLPKELENDFREEMYKFEEERRMPHVITIESMAMEKGLREGLLEGIALDLEVKFGETDKSLLAGIKALQEIGKIRKIARAVKKAKTVDAIRRLIR